MKDKNGLDLAVGDKVLVAGVVEVINGERDFLFRPEGGLPVYLQGEHVAKEEAVAEAAPVTEEEPRILEGASPAAPPIVEEEPVVTYEESAEEAVTKELLPPPPIE